MTASARPAPTARGRPLVRPPPFVSRPQKPTPAHKKKRSLIGFHRHGHLNLSDMIAVLSEAGLNIVDSGAVGISNLQFVLATAVDGIN
jgi:hypothetical protein